MDRPESSQVKKTPNRVSEKREILAAYLGCMLELPKYCRKFHDMTEAASRLEHNVEVVDGATSGSCWLELCRDPSCLIGEAPESRKEVSRLAYRLGGTV